MRPTFPSLGAMRLPLNTKRGNKDFYKGTKQAYIPGTNVRTGRPGRFPSSRKALFAVDDTKVRYFVAPPAEVLNNTKLKAYVSHSIDPYVFKESIKAYTAPARPLPWDAVKQSSSDSDADAESSTSASEPPRLTPTGLPVVPPFSPLPTQIRPEQLEAIPQWKAYQKTRAAQLESGQVDRRAQKAGWARVEKGVLRSHDFTKKYRSLTPQEKEALKWQARREWYEGQRALIGALRKRDAEQDGAVGDGL